MLVPLITDEFFKYSCSEINHYDYSTQVVFAPSAFREYVTEIVNSLFTDSGVTSLCIMVEIDHFDCVYSEHFMHMWVSYIDDESFIIDKFGKNVRGYFDEHYNISIFKRDFKLSDEFDKDMSKVIELGDNCNENDIIDIVLKEVHKLKYLVSDVSLHFEISKDSINIAYSCAGDYD